LAADKRANPTVLANDSTPISNTAKSGTTDIEARPVTPIPLLSETEVGNSEATDGTPDEGKLSFEAAKPNGTPPSFSTRDAPDDTGRTLSEVHASCDIIANKSSKNKKCEIRGFIQKDPD